MKHGKIGLLWLLLAGAGTVVAGEVAFAPAAGWTVDGARAVAAGNAGAALLAAKAPELSGSFTYDVRIRMLGKNAGETDWKNAGIVIFRDGRNFLQLALCETPDRNGGRHFVEFKQMNEGKWGSHSGIEPGEYRSDYDWQYDYEYRLSITVTPTAGIARLMTADGRVLAEMKMPWAGGQAVRSGRPALRAVGCRAEFSGASIVGDGK